MQIGGEAERFTFDAPTHAIVAAGVAHENIDRAALDRLECQLSGDGSGQGGAAGLDLPPTNDPPPSNLPADDPPVVDGNNEHLRALVEAVGGDTGVRIMVIAQDASKDVDKRIREIVALDRRLLGWSSPRLARLLNVTDGRVRQTQWWKGDRKKLTGDD
jgi:hypothetical protein